MHRALTSFRATPAGLALSFAALFGYAGAAYAQPPAQAGRSFEVSGGTGWGSLWDDETMLGRGAAVRGGAGVLLRDRLLLSGDVDWMGHTRDSGYLAAGGDVLGVFARATYLFRNPTARVRPTLGGGGGAVRSTGTLTFSSYLSGSGGPPIAGPVTQRDWTLTHGAFDVSGGVRIRVGERLWIRPEVTWRATGGSDRSESIEPPLIQVRTLVNVDLRLR